MNVQPLSVDPITAHAAVVQYKAHRDKYDKRDWEIERIYRAIARGKTVISVNDAIVRAGLDAQFRPKLAIMRADQEWCRVYARPEEIVFHPFDGRSRATDRNFSIKWPGLPPLKWWNQAARLPRIPPQFRPASDQLDKYHVLWEADWELMPPRDPYLLRRIGRDAWTVVAAWDLTDVEMSVLRSHL